MDSNDVALESLFGLYGAEVHACARVMCGEAVADVLTVRVLLASSRHDPIGVFDDRLQLVSRAHRMSVDEGRRPHATLTDDQRDAVALVTCGRCSCREAALIMGISVDDITRHLAAATTALAWPT